MRGFFYFYQPKPEIKWERITWPEKASQRTIKAQVVTTARRKLIKAALNASSTEPS
jgi:hypothetical protein